MQKQEFRERSSAARRRIIQRGDDVVVSKRGPPDATLHRRTADSPIPLRPVGACQRFPTARPPSPDAPQRALPLCGRRRRSRRKATRDSGASTSGDAGVGESNPLSRVVSMSPSPSFHAFRPLIGYHCPRNATDDTRPFRPGKIKTRKPNIFLWFSLFFASSHRKLCCLFASNN